jgi:hypothetical protein
MVLRLPYILTFKTQSPTRLEQAAQEIQYFS